MKGRVVVNTQRQRVLDSIVGLCRESPNDQKKMTTSTTLETSIVELVRENMREDARNVRAPIGKGDLLRAALEQTESEILAALEACGVECDLDQFFEVASKDLRHTAAELSELSTSLIESRKSKRVKDHLVAESATEKSFTIHQIGLEGFPTGLLAKPAGEESIELDFDALREQVRCIFEGDAFPLEVVCDDQVFVVDDDGSVFVSVDGLPANAVERTNGLLRQIGRALYA